jgi:hypothetical protein
VVWNGQSTRYESVRSTIKSPNKVNHMTRAQSLLSIHIHIHTIHSIPPVSYLDRAESSGSQGCHDDHGDKNLGGGIGSGHLGYFVVAVVPVPLVRRFNRRSTDSEILPEEDPSVFHIDKFSVGILALVGKPKYYKNSSMSLYIFKKKAAQAENKYI